LKLYHGTNYSSAMNIVNNGISLEYSKPYLDFGAGFYTTPSYDHAALTAIRATKKYNIKNRVHEEPYIVEVDYKPKKEIELSILSYPRHSKKWGEFVLYNRLTPQVLSTYNIVTHNQNAKYDVCCGEIADGNIVNIAYQVNNKIIELKNVDYNDFLKDNGEAIFVPHNKAVSCINVLSCAIIKNKEKYLNK